MKRPLLLCAAVGLLSAAAWGEDLLVLKNGRRLNGTMVSASAGKVRFKPNNGAQRTFNLSAVQSIEFDVNSGVLSNGAVRNNLDNRDRANPRYATQLSIPAGTEVSVRTNEAIDSEVSGENHTYSGVVDNDVVSGGTVVIPRGADARLVVRRFREPGTTREAELQLDLDSVSVNGRNYRVSTEDLEQSGRDGIGKNKRTAEMVGGGAALGAIIGAIAGGGKGAAIGAGVGAAAGGTTQVLTRGKRVRVPAESVLTFRLDQPVTLR